MPALLLLLDQCVSTLHVLFDERVFELGDTLVQLPLQVLVELILEFLISCSYAWRIDLFGFGGCHFYEYQYQNRIFKV